MTREDITFNSSVLALEMETPGGLIAPSSPVHLVAQTQQATDLESELLNRGTDSLILTLETSAGIIAGAPGKAGAAQASAGPPATPGVARVQKIAPRKKPAPLDLWELESLKSSALAVDKAILVLSRTCIAILQIKIASGEPKVEMATNYWGAAKAWGPPERIALWTGFNWDPGLQRGLWATFMQNGYYEIAPAAASEWSLIMRLFGAQGREFLSFLRLATGETLCMLSKQSLASSCRDLASPAPVTAPLKKAA